MVGAQWSMAMMNAASATRAPRQRGHHSNHPSRQPAAGDRRPGRQAPRRDRRHVRLHSMRGHQPAQASKPCRAALLALLPSHMTMLPAVRPSGWRMPSRRMEMTRVTHQPPKTTFHTEATNDTRTHQPTNRGGPRQGGGRGPRVQLRGVELNRVVGSGGVETDSPTVDPLSRVRHLFPCRVFHHSSAR